MDCKCAVKMSPVKRLWQFLVLHLLNYPAFWSRFNTLWQLDPSLQKLCVSCRKQQSSCLECQLVAEQTSYCSYVFFSRFSARLWKLQAAHFEITVSGKCHWSWHRANPLQIHVWQLCYTFPSSISFWNKICLFAQVFTLLTLLWYLRMSWMISCFCLE